MLAYLLLEPPKTLMHSILLAPVLSATLSSDNNLVGRSISDAENKIGCRIVMIERITEEGALEVQIPTQVESLEMSDKIYI